MAKSQMSKDSFERFWCRARENSFFLASALGLYLDLHRIQPEALAAHLKCGLDDLVRMGSCRNPDSKANIFRKEVEEIARFGHCSAENLAAVIREVSALNALRSVAGDVSDVCLMAARDRKPSDATNGDCFDDGSKQN